MTTPPARRSPAADDRRRRQSSRLSSARRLPPSEDTEVVSVPSDALPLGPALRALAAIGPPVTIATALLFYFGWTRTSAQASAMGLDESIFAMSTRDYVLRSLDALYLPLLVGAACVLVWVLVHGVALDRLDSRRQVDTIAAAARVLTWTAWWVSVLIAGAVVVLLPMAWSVVVPLVLAAGLLLTEYGIRLRTHSRRAAGGTTTTTRPAWVPVLRSVLVGVLVTILLFWEVAAYAEVVGRGRADEVIAGISERPSAIVFSQLDLHLESTGIAAQPIGDELSRYRFRYDGLRLLQHTGDTYYLVPDDWRPGARSLVVLPEHASLRLEFVGPQRGAATGVAG